MMEEDCKKLFALCMGYIDGELNPQELEQVVKRLEQHKCCAHCIETLQMTKQFLARLKQERAELPPELAARLKECMKGSSS